MKETVQKLLRQKLFPFPRAFLRCNDYIRSPIKQPSGQIVLKCNYISLKISFCSVQVFQQGVHQRQRENVLQCSFTRVSFFSLLFSLQKVSSVKKVNLLENQCENIFSLSCELMQLCLTRICFLPSRLGFFYSECNMESAYFSLHMAYNEQYEVSLQVCSMRGQGLLIDRFRSFHGYTHSLPLHLSLLYAHSGQSVVACNYTLSTT